jgi:hypothetical protein
MVEYKFALKVRDENGSLRGECTESNGWNRKRQGCKLSTFRVKRRGNSWVCKWCFQPDGS